MTHVPAAALPLALLLAACAWSAPQPPTLTVRDAQHEYVFTGS